jgi:hypothetical protein
MALPRNRRIPALLGLLFACSLIFAAGCGGGDDGGETATTTTDDYISQADAVCSESDAQNAAAFRQAFGNEQPTTAEAAAYVGDVLVPALETQLEQLRALSPPEGDTETVNAIWDRIADVIETMKEDPEASLGIEDPFADVTPEAEAYGFKSCGVSSGVGPADSGSSGTTGPESGTTDAGTTVTG